MENDCPIRMDFDKLKNRLKEIEELPKTFPIDPARGLKGDLLRKVVAGMAGHRSGILTDEDEKRIKQIQLKYDYLQRRKS